MIELDGVGLRYEDGPHILKDVTLSLTPGSFRFLIGPSGAGKTSLLRVMALALAPVSGRVSLFDTPVFDSTASPAWLASRRNRAALRQRIGMIFQDFRLLGHLTAQQNVELPLRIRGADPARIDRDVSEILDWVGLDGLRDRFPASLSGGEQQRIALARAVITRPKLILADEPTGNVDDAMSDRLIRLLVELHRMGAAVLVATHSARLVERFPYPRLTLAEGRLRDIADSQQGDTRPPSQPGAAPANKPLLARTLDTLGSARQAEAGR